MRFIHTALTLLMILSVCCIVPAAAHPAAEPIVNLEILTAEDVSDIFRAPPVDGSVTQNQKVYHTHYVDGTDTTLEVSLQWSGTNGNILQLIIYPPNRTPIYVKDEMDGIRDGRIAFRISLPGDTVNAVWNLCVEGVQVTGSQDYTLIVNSV